MTHYLFTTSHYMPIYGNYTHIHCTRYTDHGGIFTSSEETGRLKDNKRIDFWYVVNSQITYYR